MISDGWVRDVNGDGIIERIDSTNCAIRDGIATSLLEVLTFERKPRRLLQVVYNWHPEDDSIRRSDNPRDWSYECVEQDGSGKCLIAFGPEIDGELQPEVVFGWDAGAGGFRALEGGEHPHIKVLDDGDPWAQLKQLDRDGGLGYAPGSAPDDQDAEPDAETPASPQTYRHRSLAGLSDEELKAFMGGEETPDDFFDSEGPETHAPDGLRDMKPKDAALALADANRTAAHRRAHPLAVDDRGGLEAPDSGWLLWQFTSSGCYTRTGHVLAVRFGTESPVLIHASTSQNGVVAANRLADRTGYMVRFIELDRETARFFADVVFWLDRVRSAPSGEGGHFGGMHSTADGFGTLTLSADGAKPLELASTTVWATGSIAHRWNGAYDRETFVNLAGYLLDRVVPDELGDRWDVMPPIAHRNLGTPLEERLKPRQDSDLRDHLAGTAASVFAHDALDPVPASLLAWIVDAVGEVGLVPLLPEIEKLASQLPQADGREAELRELGKRFADTYSEPDDEPARSAWRRLQELETWSEFDRGAQLREPLAVCLRQLRSIENPDDLVDWAGSRERGSVWALQQLQLRWPDDYTKVLIERFPDADAWGRKTIFATLAAAHPPGARLLRSQLTDAQLGDLAIELAEFEIENEPELAASRVPALLAIVEDPGGTRNWRERNPALRLLSRLPLDEQAGERLEKILLAELREPRRDQLRMSSFGAVTGTLAARPDPDRFWDALAASGDKATKYGEFGPLVEALAQLVVANRELRGGRFEDFLRPRFDRHKGLMNDLFLTALALDLRGLRPEIERLATVGPAVPDGEGANSWGGNFEGPGENRYHGARHVIALWDEPDPATRARMWSMLVASEPYQFALGGATIASELCARAEAALRQVPAETRKACIDGLLQDDGVSRYEKTVEWLNGLREETPE